MWNDTALIVTTDHGFLLGEHDWWAKIRMPCYNEVAHIPLFLHDPGKRERAGTRCATLTQTIDIAPTLLDLFGAAAAAGDPGPFAAADCCGHDAAARRRRSTAISAAR